MGIIIITKEMWGEQNVTMLAIGVVYSLLGTQDKCGSHRQKTNIIPLHISGLIRLVIIISRMFY